MGKRGLALLVIGLGLIFLCDSGAAVAQEYILTVTQTGDGHGSVTSSPPGISGTDTTEKYAQGKQVTLKAKADKNSYFDGWSGEGCSGTGTCKITMNSDITVAAAFKIRTPSIQVTPESLNFGHLEVGEKKTLPLTIANIGTANLIVSASVADANPEVVIRTSSSHTQGESEAVVLGNNKSKTMTIKPGKSQTLKVTVQPKSAGGVKTKVKLTSNDPKKPVVEVDAEEEELAPLNMIVFANVDEINKEMEMVGMFISHKDESRVTVGGKEVTVKSWSDKVIVCDLPIDRAGDIQITRLNGEAISNKVPLTRWKGKFEFTMKAEGTLKETMSCDVHIRADIHPFYDAPTGQVIKPIVPFMGVEASMCHYELSGSYKHPKSGCVETWFGSGDMVIREPNVEGAFVVEGMVDSQQGKLYLVVYAGGGAPDHGRMACPDSTETFTVSLGPSLNLYDDPTFTGGPAFVLELDSQFGIVGGHRGPILDYDWTHEAQWNKIPAEFPPAP
jgi:hypothetical protein